MTTMRDVARRAGVSSATVSFVVNGTKPVTKETRERIEAAMDELGFRANVLARGLASKRTRIIALLYPALAHRLGISALQIVTSAATTASERGYNLVLWPVSNDAKQMTELLAGGLVDGVLLMEDQMEDPRVAALERTETPFALIGRTREPSAVPFADIDFEGTVTDGLDYLFGLGHRTIALIMTSLVAEDLEGYGPFVRTERAFRDAMNREGLDAAVYWAEPSQPGGRAVVDTLLNEVPDVSAVIVANEDAAPAIVSRLVESGRSVPDDISVLSILTTPELARMSNPVLTSMNIQQAQLGGSAYLRSSMNSRACTPNLRRSLCLRFLRSTRRPALLRAREQRSAGTQSDRAPLSRPSLSE